MLFIEAFRTLFQNFNSSLIINISKFKRKFHAKHFSAISKQRTSESTLNHIFVISLYNICEPIACWCIFLLSSQITREDLIQLFTLCGYVLEVRIIKKPPFVYSYAHVDFADSVSREKAKKFYHGKKLGDKFLLVEDKISRSRIYPKAAIKTDNSDK